MNLIRKKEIETAHAKKTEHMNNALPLPVNPGRYYCFFISHETGKLVLLFISSV